MDWTPNEVVTFVKNICQAYDGEYGTYPESEWEGLKIFERVLIKLEGIKKCPHCGKPMYLKAKYEGGNCFNPKNIQYVFICYECDHEEVI